MNDFVGRLSDFHRIQSGGEAVVYRALLDGKENVAVRIALAADGMDRNRVEVLSSHEISGTPRFEGMGSLDGKSFTVSEYIRGVSSASVSPMPPKIALRLARKVVSSLSALSASGVLHGDLSPENVLVDSAGNAVLIDGGIRGLGTPRFAAPERFEGAEASVRSELFSLGALLYFWIAGEPLFNGETFGSIESAVFQVDSYDESLLLHGKGKLGPSEIRVFQSLWKGTLRKDPEDRFEDFDECDECLEIAESELNLEDSFSEMERIARWKDDLGLGIREREDRIDAAPVETPKGFIVETKSSETNIPTRWLVRTAVALAFVLLLIVFIFYGKKGSPEVEIVGKSMLEHSRSLQLGEEPERIRSDSKTRSVRGIVTDADSLSVNED